MQILSVSGLSLPPLSLSLSLSLSSSLSLTLFLRRELSKKENFIFFISALSLSVLLPFSFAEIQFLPPSLVLSFIVNWFSWFAHEIYYCSTIYVLSQTYISPIFLNSWSRIKSLRNRVILSLDTSGCNRLIN